MTKMLVSLNKLSDLDKVLELDINAILFSIEDLSVNSNFYITLDTLRDVIPKIKEKNIEIFISLNKIMHNDDLSLLEDTLKKLDTLDIDKILFYDLSIINIAKRLKTKKDLVVYQNHLNASINSNNFYYQQGIKGSVLTSEITLNDIIDIKENTNLYLIVPVYGHPPMFYSRRYLLTNYFSYIKKNRDSNHYLLKHNDEYYHIKEEKYGTSIYHSRINYIMYASTLMKHGIDYLYFNFEFDDNYNVINEYLGKSKIVTEEAEGFLKTETIYKVKNDG